MVSAAVLRALELVRDFLSVRGEADDPVAALYEVGQTGVKGSGQVPCWSAELLRVSDGGRVHTTGVGRATGLGDCCPDR